MNNELQTRLYRTTTLNDDNSSYALKVDTGMHYSQYTEEITGNIESTAKITPADGKKLCIRGVHINTNSNNETVSLDFATSTKPVARLYASAQNDLTDVFGHLAGAADEALSVTIAGGAGTQKTFVSVMYTEHD